MLKCPNVLGMHYFNTCLLVFNIKWINKLNKNLYYKTKLTFFQINTLLI